jgi:Type II CAAX prenyl endopeptidase Rce1-like
LADSAVALGQVTSESTTLPVFSVSRRTRVFGLLILLAASFAPSLFNSTIAFLDPHPYGSSSDLGYLRVLLKQFTCLALLVYVLHRNGQTTSDIGFRLRPADLAHAGLLIIASWFAFEIPHGIAMNVYTAVLGHSPSRYVSPLATTGLTVSILTALVNPFFEELIVRAFFISEIILLTGSTALAVALSVFLQTAYHLYQGVPNAVGHGFVFLMFSLYYVKKRQAWPIILAHMYSDVYAVMHYAQHIR